MIMSVHPSQGSRYQYTFCTAQQSDVFSFLASKFVVLNLEVHPNERVKQRNYPWKQW